MILLFDLDGTVLTFDDGPPGPGRTALDLAMRELHGVENACVGMRVAGGTDRALARALLLRAAIADDERAIGVLLDAYVAHLEVVLRTRRYRPVGAVARTVEACRARAATVSVATGNLRAGARLKLESAGLAGSFDLDVGGYGCDAEPRPDILRAAVRRSVEAGARAGDAVVVIGDTEHDVSAARAIGARVVGVATTHASRAELVAAGAETIVPDCGDALLRALFE